MARGPSGQLRLVGTDLLLANTQRYEGDAAAAARSLVAVLQRLAEVRPYPDARTARAKGYLAQALIDLGRHDEAAQLADEAARIAAEWLASDHPLTSQAKYIRAPALDKTGQREQSAALMNEAQAAFQAKLGKPLVERLMRVLY